jgi:hypothetical protein
VTAAANSDVLDRELDEDENLGSRGEMDRQYRKDCTSLEFTSVR